MFNQQILKKKLKQESRRILGFTCFIYFVKNVDLKHHKITQIHPDTFRRFNRLTLIDLGWNQITHLEEDIFHGLPNLTEINLGWNQITHLGKDIFGGLTRLTEINLTSNLITHIDQEVFHGLINLVKIDLSSNKIIKLHRKTFDGLKSVVKIDLTTNQIAKIEAETFQGLTNLAGIYLNFNRIRKIDESLFNGLANLTQIHLNYNQIQEIKKETFKGLNKLIRIDLSSNKIKEIDKETFQDLNSLNELSLRSNELTHIDKELFCDLINLAQIDLSSNQITRLEKEFFHGIKNLTSINLSLNRISQIDMDTFRGLNYLTTIKMHGNEFKGSFLKLFLEESVGFISWGKINIGNEIHSIIQKDTFKLTDFNSIEEIGSGSFGVVWLVEEKNTKLDFAMKKILCSNNTMAIIQQELQILETIQNDFIMTFEDSFNDGQIFCILTQYYEKGDLNKRIKKAIQDGNKKFSVGQIQEWTRQMTAAIFYLHRNDIIHRDFKPANVFLAENGSIKVGDFGVSKLIDSTVNISTYAGTFEYMSPEVRDHKIYSFNTDCWSLGCVLYELITLVKFHNRSRSTVDEIQTEISNLETSDLCKQLLVMMLQIDKANRAESYRLFKMFDKIN